MAWPTRSKLLAISKVNSWVAGVWTNVGGPAAGHTWLIKAITAYNGTTTTRRFYFRIIRAGANYNVRTIDTGPDGGNYDPVNIVLEAGDTIEWTIGGATYAGQVVVSMHGALLG